MPLVLDQPVALGPDESLYRSAINLKFQGKSYDEISAVVGRKVQTVRTWFAKHGKLHKPYHDHCEQLLSPKVNPEITGAYTQSIADRLKAAAPTALDSIIDLSKASKRDQVKYQASADILDRAGYKPVERSVNLNASLEEMSADQINSVVDSIMSRHGLGLPAVDVVDSGPVIEAGAVHSDVVDDTAETVGHAYIEESASVHTERATPDGVGMAWAEGVSPAGETLSSPTDSSPKNVPVNQTENEDINGGNTH